MSDSSQSSPPIFIKGAAEHNLQRIDVTIPRGQLVVITGVSGSGKSSLAFDTLYAEGYRKYVDSLSVKARQVLEQIKRPEVEYISGLSPVIAIEQRSGAGNNPRATVASVTEIADYARLLWSVMGEAHCPKDGGRIVRRSLEDCLERIFEEPDESRLMILAPFLDDKTSRIRDEIPRLKQRGFTRVRVNDEVKFIDDYDLIPKGQSRTKLDLVIDRVVVRQDQRSRIADSLELAFREGEDRVVLLFQSGRDDPWKEIALSQNLSCSICGEVYEPLTPRLFSHNHHEGACETCDGLGTTLQFVPELLVPDPSKSVKKGAVKPWRIGSKKMIIRRNALLKQLAEQVPFDPTVPWSELSEEVRDLIFWGSGERTYLFKLRPGKAKPEPAPFEGVVPELNRTARESSSDGYRARLVAYQISQTCQSCGGRRLNAVARNVFVSGKSFDQFMALPIEEAYDWILQCRKAWGKLKQFDELVTGLEQRLGFVDEVGLGYLNLDREFSTLSGGESQRVRLATQLGMGLVGVIYVLDEPSIGLHPYDNEKLIQTLLDLRDRGNAVVVVEHDEEMMKHADTLIELGPGAGIEGGKLIFQGTTAECMKTTKSRTGPYLSGKLTVMKNSPTHTADDRRVEVLKAAEHNLRSIDVPFPVGLLTCVTGVSGSGKSTLVNDILANAAAFKLNRAKTIPGKHERILGLEHFTQVVRVDQSPIGRSPRSNPATYIKLFDLLRQLFAQTPLSKVRGYKPARFSFNVSGGRCERCQGAGVIKLDMQFLADTYVECPSCRGQRYNRETLEVRFKGYTIADILNMTVREASEVFRNFPKISRKLETLDKVGLGYIHLGQQATTLSGGEAQRIKLSLELSRTEQGASLYILDEPTTGLHWIDIQLLMDLLLQLRDHGNTVIIIEHNLDVINLADWVVDLGPGGGNSGGDLVYAGTREKLIDCETSLTGKMLKASGKHVD
ncbi:MAG: excinuclease ABC subunit UvrA [Verrucomicrobiae bacterium]|nr:excinuclease ABC subunit UvrA [Verrucomicrobiae bacterium]